MKQEEILNELASQYRRLWGDNSLEAVLGHLSTITTDEQLEVLLSGLKRQK